MEKIRFYYTVLNKWSTVVFLSFLLLPSLFAQNQDQTVPLISVLESAERRFDVIFSYADENIVGKYIQDPGDHFDLGALLDYLTRNTDLTFEQLDNRSIAVIAPEKTNEICGYLIDTETREPIVAASIRGNGQKSMVLSNHEGFFRISADQPAEITFKHLGYSTESRIIYPSQTCPEIEMTPRTAQLEAVYVSNYLVQGVDKKVSGEFEINTHELQVLPGLSEPDVLYIMQTLPGIQSPNESVSNINIRGGTNDQNLIMWDGIKMYQSSHFYGLISAFNPYFTEDVTLTKNGTSARLGDGISGTIDIRSTNRITNEFSGGAGVNLLSADAYAQVPLAENASLSISGRRSLADIVQTPTYQNYFDRAFRNTEVTAPSSADSLIGSDEDFIFYDLSTKLNLAISDKDRLYVSFLNIFNDLSYQENELIGGEVESRTSSLTQKSLASGASYSRRWSQTVKTTLNAYTSFYQLEGLNYDIPNDQRLLQQNEVLEGGVKLETRMILNPEIDLYTGLHYTETGITNLEDINNPDFRRRIKEVMRSQVAFLEGNYTSPTGEINIRTGLRANYYSTLKYFLLEPRLAVRYEFMPDLSLELLGEYKNQTSTQIIDLQNDFLGVEKRRWVLSNGQDIPVIQSKQISAGLHYDHNNFLISGEGYVKLVDGIITSSQGFQNQFEFLRSSGSYRIHGIDFLINKRFQKFGAWLSYAVAKNSYEFPQLSVTSFPNNLDILHNITVGASYKCDHFQVSSSFNWHSGRPFTPVNADNPVAANRISYQSPNSSRLGEYMRIDLSGKYSFDLNEEMKAQLGFSIWNLSGYENTLSTYYRLTDAEELREIRQRGLTFTPNAMFRISF